MNAFGKVIIASLLTLSIEAKVASQVETHLYLFTVEQKDDCYAVSKPRYLSAFNPCGNTDHPAFTPLGDILVSAKLNEEDQHDIWILSPETETCKRLTQTCANEFSPRVTPDGRYYSVLRQVKSDSASRQVWQFPVFGGKYK
jgi:Tol biopolymer transport system component